MWAAYNEHDNTAIIRALLDKGADVNIKAPDGATALSWAMKKRKNSNSKLAYKSGSKIKGHCQKLFYEKWLVITVIAIIVAAFTNLPSVNKKIDPEEIKMLSTKACLYCKAAVIFFRKCRRLSLLPSPGSGCS